MSDGTLKVSKSVKTPKPKPRVESRIPKPNSPSPWLSEFKPTNTMKDGKPDVRANYQSSIIATPSSEPTLFLEKTKSRTKPVEVKDDDVLNRPVIADLPNGGSTENVIQRPASSEGRLVNPVAGRIKPDALENHLSLESVGGLASQLEQIKGSLVFDPKIQAQLSAKWGYEPAKAVLFYGPSDCGKTFLLQALVSELNKNRSGPNVRLFNRNAKDLLVNAERICDLFEQAKTLHPSIILLTDLEALSSTLTDTDSDSGLKEMITKSLVHEIDKMKAGKVFLIGEANNLEQIDPVLLQRFVKKIAFQPPIEEERAEILRIKVGKWVIKPSEEVISAVARHTDGFTPADLENLACNAFDRALSRCISSGVGIEQLQVTTQDWEQAYLKSDALEKNKTTSSYVLSPKLAPLFETICSEIQVQLESILVRMTQKSFNEHEPKFILFFGENESEVFLLNEYLLPAALSSSHIDKTARFQLDHVDILLDYKFKSTNTLNETFAKIHSCESKVVLLVFPEIDMLFSKQKVYEKFKRLILSSKDKSVIIIATARHDFPGLQQDLSWLMNLSSIKLRKPKSKERRVFLQPLFNPNAKFYKGECMKGEELITKLNALLEDAVKSTEHKDAKAIMNLQQELSQICDTYLEEAIGCGDDRKTAGPLTESISQKLKKFKAGRQS